MQPGLTSKNKYGIQQTVLRHQVRQINPHRLYYYQLRIRQTVHG